MSLFKTLKISVLGAALSSILACSPQAEESKTNVEELKPQITHFVVDEDYKVIRDTPSKTPELTEYFSLYCGHCYRSEEKFKQLKSTLSAGIPFNRAHVMFLPQQRPEWGKNMTFAVASANKLNVEDKFIDYIFDSHFVQEKYVGEYAQLQTIFEKLDVNATDFKAAMNDENTLEAVRNMVNGASDDKVRFTPDLIVNDKYRVLLPKLDLAAKARGISAQQQLNELVAFLLTNP